MAGHCRAGLANFHYRLTISAHAQQKSACNSLCAEKENFTCTSDLVQLRGGGHPVHMNYLLKQEQCTMALS